MTDAAARDRLNAETDSEEHGLRVPFSAQASALAPEARRRLITLLFVKLTLDLIFVGALAVYTQAIAFHPFFSGSLDYADGESVRGWVVDRAAPDESVEVQLYIEGRFVADRMANEPRPDVSAKGFAQDERHGFVFKLDPPLAGEHEVRVYAVHASRDGMRRTLQQIGNTLRVGKR